MSSLFSTKMEKDQGDLADIVRGGGTSGGGGGVNGANTSSNWRGDGSFLMEELLDNFGDPFSNMHDPLLHELDIPSSSSTSPGLIFNTRSSNSSSSSHVVHMNIEQEVSLASTSNHVLDHESMRRPTPNIFSRMLQISPKMTTSGNESIKSNTSMESVGMMQISSPRNPAGIKRRKSQAKKVVCIPAPAAANSSRPSGEVVPSDLWAWRKYGQKPIKGSPYPRGYYRCSSSKGCSARKQVERSRTDPNMLVITYTSEHNHPWPTQRNALAGSTRSQPPKNNANAKASTTKVMKEEAKDDNVTESMSISVVDGTVNVTTTSIKEEINEIGDMHEKVRDLGNFQRSFAPTGGGVLGANQPVQADDFFADLGELEYDPLKLLFTQGFNGEKGEDQGRDTTTTTTTNNNNHNNKPLDPFSLFDWAGNSNMFGDNKRGGGL